jgi:hypothetical protein
MSEENEDIGAVAMALTIEANENTLGLAIRVRNEFNLIEDDLKIEFVTNWILMLNEFKRVLIAEKSDQNVMH